MTDRVAAVSRALDPDVKVQTTTAECCKSLGTVLSCVLDLWHSLTCILNLIFNFITGCHYIDESMAS